MKVIIIKPFTNPYTANIKGDLRSMQEIVGGYIEVIYPFDNPEIALICNEEGKLEGLQPNRFILNRNTGVCDFIFGDFFLCYAPQDSEDFESIPDELVPYYIDKFSMKKGA